MRRKGRLVLVVAVFCCLCLALPALAAEQLRKTQTDISVNELKAILNGLGFVPELSKDNLGDPVLRISLGGRVATFRVMFVFYEKIADGRYRDIQLYCAFKRPVRMDEAQLVLKVNEFNRRYRLTRLYVDREGDPAIESDLTLEGGVTDECIKVFIRNYESAVMNLKSFMQQ